MKKTTRLGIISIITLLALMMSVCVYAATTVNILDGKVTITDSIGNGSGTAESYTATAKGGLISKKTNTVTIANASGADGVISFNYNAASANAFTVAGATASADGRYSNTITAGGTVVITIQSKSGISDLTATLTLTNITFEEMAESSDMTYMFDSNLGTVTAGGTAIASGDIVTVNAEGTEIVATANSGATFLGWIDEENNIVSTSASYTQQAVSNKTITAIFSDNTVPYFMVDEKCIFSDLNSAAKAGSVIVLMNNGTLEAGNYTIPSGVTLLIPMDATNTVYTNVPASAKTSYSTPKVYRKLTLESGANITVNGAISLAGKLSASQGSHGSLIGTYGQIDMNSGSTITVNSGAKLYCWGYITGLGSVTAKSGATVYEPFQVRDWRGGDATTSMLNNNQRVFPMSQYYVQNVEVPLTLEAGAVENGFMAVYVTGTDLLGGDGIQKSEVPFIGPSGMFNIESGSIVKDYDENTDRLVINVNNGTLGMQSLTLSMKITALGGASSIDSSRYTLPVNGNITLHINEGSTVNVSQEMALLPGGEIYVHSGATCNFIDGTKAFIYDSSEWGAYCAHTNKTFLAANHAPGRKYTRTDADLKDALVYVEGTVNASAGYAYTTASGADICGGEGGMLSMQHGTDTVTYQVTQSNTDISVWNEIPVTVAKLKNADDTYVEPQKLGECGKNFTYKNGVWEPDHKDIVTVTGTAATCTQTGLTDGIICNACGTVIQEQTEIPLDTTKHSYGEWVADGDNHKKECACGDVATESHSWNTGEITTQPTHLAEGVKTYTCTVCSGTKTEAVAKTTEHEWDAGVVTTQPTCTVNGVKTYTCTVCSGTKTEEISATGHLYGEWTKVDAKNHSRECVCGDVETKSHEFDGFACTLCGCEKVVTETSYIIENGEIKINTELIWDVPEDTQIIVALYTAEGKVISAVTNDAFELAEITFDAESIAQIKVFAWQGTGFITPISVAEEIFVTNGI